MTPQAPIRPASAAQATGSAANARSARRVPVDPWLVCAALLALLPITTLLRPGMPNTADGQVHLLRTLEVVRLLREGILYPRWAPDLYLGYGYPFFNFYAPGAHILAALLALAGLGVVRGVVALQIAGLIAYPVGAYLAAREVLPAGPARAPASLLSAALYLYAPLRCRELYIQGNLSQLLALALLPWCAWLLGRAARQGTVRASLAAGVSLAALVYLHHPSAFLAYPLLALYAAAIALMDACLPGVRGTQTSAGPKEDHVGAGLVPARRVSPTADTARGRAWRHPEGGHKTRPYGAVAGAFALGVALSAPFWLPALAEMRDANLAAIAAGMFSARLNLVPLRELFALPAVLDSAALNPPMPNSLGIAQAVLALPGLAVAAWWVVSGSRAPAVRQAGILLLVVAALLAGCLAMVLPQAGPIWDNLPLARTIAFPWRLLGPALLFASLLGGAAFYLVPARARTPALVALMLLVPLGIATYLFPRPFAAVEEPTVASIARYELNGGARGTASANEYLPRWVQDPTPPTTQAQAMLEGRQPERADAATLPAGSQVETLRSGLTSDRFRVTLPAASVLGVRRFYFPGWTARVDGATVPIMPSAPYGLIQVPVPAGSHEVDISFGTTGPRAAGDALAVLGVVGAGWAAWWARRPTTNRATNTCRIWRGERAADVWPGAGARISPHPVDPQVGAGLVPAHAAPRADRRVIRIRHHAPGGHEGRPYPHSPRVGAGLVPAHAAPRADRRVIRIRRHAPGGREGRPYAAVNRAGEIATATHGEGTRRSALAASITILAIALVKTAWIEPATGWFRHLSPVSEPAGMQHAVHATFRNGVELIGYDLLDGEPAQGGTVAVRLYWRALAAGTANARPFLHLDALTGDATWANQTKINAGDKPMSSWPAGFFVVDDYSLEVPPGTPPVVADLCAGLSDASGARVPLVDGGDQAVLGPVRVREASPRRAGSLPGHDQTYALGASVRLVGHAVALPAGSVDVLLYWQAPAHVPVDYTVFVHVFDGQGRQVGQADGQPVNGWYPSSRWAPGQIVEDFRSIKLPPGTGTAGLKVAAGLYTLEDGRRPEVTDAAGARQPDDQIWLAAE